MSPAAPDRATEIAARLAEVRRRLDDACAQADRDPAELTLIVATKHHDASDVRILAAHGVTDVGESRDQDAKQKAAECADLGLRWHFIGQLQRNKASSVSHYADLVHTLDRRELVTTLAAAASRRGNPLSVLLQVNLDGRERVGESDMRAVRGGVHPADVLSLAETVAAEPSLRLRGVMGLAPRAGESSATPAAGFALLRECAEALRAAHPDAWLMSAGMSGDFEAAIAAGATHVRIGAAVLGIRPVLQ